MAFNLKQSWKLSIITNKMKVYANKKRYDTSKCTALESKNVSRETFWVYMFHVKHFNFISYNDILLHNH